MGDSHTYGMGLEYKNSFVGKIEKNFKNYKVLNLAVPSYSPTIYNYQLKKIIKSKNKPNKIFLILDIGDIAQESFRWETKKNLRPNLITEIPKIKEEKDSGWKRFRRENFKGYRIIVYNLRELSRSIRKTVEPKITLFFFSNLVISITFARAIKSFISIILLSIFACSSFAA